VDYVQAKKRGIVLAEAASVYHCREQVQSHYILVRATDCLWLDNPQTGVASEPKLWRRHVRSRCRCSMCLQFALSHAASCALHRPMSRVIYEWSGTSTSYVVAIASARGRVRQRPPRAVVLWLCHHGSRNRLDSNHARRQKYFVCDPLKKSIWIINLKKYRFSLSCIFLLTTKVALNNRLPGRLPGSDNLTSKLVSYWP
jgi:hypothetical protein